MAISMTLGQDCPENQPLRLVRIIILLIVGVFPLPRIQSQEQVMSNSSQTDVQVSTPAWMKAINQKLEDGLIKKYGETQHTAWVAAGL